jgi:transposase
MTYSLDLINAILNFHKISNVGLRKTAKIFGVSKSVLFNWNKHLPLKYTNIENINLTITPEMLKFLKNSLNQNPYQTQKEMQERINKRFDYDISQTIIQKMLKILNYTKKKACRKFYNKNLKELLCNKKKFKKIAKTLNKDKIICLDEVGITKNTYNIFGYCQSSKRLQYYVDINKLKIKKSLIVAISNKTVVKYEVLENKNVNGEIFLKFIKELTEKYQNKIFLMDNVNFHRNKIIREIIEKSNNEILFIPPYSPEFNPIEKLFSVFKNYINKKVNIITKFKNLNKHIDDFFEKSKNFDNYYNYSFG